ncbi:MAG: PIG-L family deacetylase [Clostridia bacterium]|nr:PIG-L family deacetylase [Clostridia bacterium]
MKRIVFLILYLLLTCACAHAQVARDVTKECSLAYDYRETPVKNMTDGDYKTAMEGKPAVYPQLVIKTGDTPVSSIYVEFGKNRQPFGVYLKQEGEWKRVASCNAAHAQEYVTFPATTGTIRVRFDTARKAKRVDIAEVHLYSEGETPPAVHDWKATNEKTDLMVVVAHPDDELLWLGGTIPHYAAAGKKVTVVYLTCGDYFRELELLNGLWHCGVRNYPVLAGYRDFKPGSTRGVYDDWGRVSVNYYLTTLIRTLRPEVVVTHDLKGEYGHPQHIVCAYTVERAVKFASQAKYGTEEIEAVPVWNVKKLYVHLGDKPTTVMNWDVKETAFGGKSSFAVASEAYAMHISQQAGRTYEMAAKGSEYDAYVYTLAYTTVGADKKGGDFFENVP